MIKKIDSLLNSITMYRLILYGLIVMTLYSLLLSALHILSFPMIALSESLILLLAICCVSNWIFSQIVKAQTNTESWIITALILYFILLPITGVSDALWIGLTAAIAMASKYIVAIQKKHIFNPVALSLVIINILGASISFWWIGTAWFLPLVSIVGILIVRKIRRFHLLLAFLISAIIGLLIQHISFQEMFTTWPLLFFGTIMLTEPLTTPPTYNLRIVYGIIAGILFTVKFQFGPLFSTPELALIIANMYSYVVGSKIKLELTLQKITHLTSSIYEFSFIPNQFFAFKPGQYLEWTLSHSPADSRGNRRYFTIASSPTEKTTRLVVKIAERSSSFKKKLLSMKPGEHIIASQLTGDFTLPDNQSEKLVFIAGGIGITPFRSMIKYLTDHKQQRDIVLIYLSSTSEFVYQDEFENAKKEILLRVFFQNKRLTTEFIKKEIPNYKNRIFYLSGPSDMVNNYKSLLRSLGVSRIKIDYFPGF